MDGHTRQAKLFLHQLARQSRDGKPLHPLLVLLRDLPAPTRKQSLSFVYGVVAAAIACLLLSTFQAIDFGLGPSDGDPGSVPETLPLREDSSSPSPASRGSSWSAHSGGSGSAGRAGRRPSSPCGGVACDPLGPLEGGQFGRCQMRTKSGLCAAELFHLYDDAYRPLWPGRVDLLIRSFVSDKSFLLEMLFDSVELMWPRGIGDVVLVLDEKNEVAQHIVPHWVKVFYEKNYLRLPGKILQQWSYLWADNYTTAEFIAIVDDDVVFNLKVTPALLFNLTDGKPYVIGSRQKQRNHWVPSTRFFVGRDKYFANFMVQLPFVFPRVVLPKFRAHVVALHENDSLPSFDAAMKHFSLKGPRFERTQIAHTTLGNFMWAYTNNEVHWAMEWSNHQPIPRVGVHIPYCLPFRDATNHSDKAPRVVKIYVELAAYYAHEAVCNAFPRGELDGCEKVLQFPQRQIWVYVMDWFDWPMIRKKARNSTFVYDQYKNELHCMYNTVVGATVDERDAHRQSTYRQQLLHQLRVKCMATDSN